MSFHLLRRVQELEAKAPKACGVESVTPAMFYAGCLQFGHDVSPPDPGETVSDYIQRLPSSVVVDIARRGFHGDT